MDDVKRVEDMNDAELGAELRKFGIDSEALMGNMIEKLFESLRSKITENAALKARAEKAEAALKRMRQPVTDEEQHKLWVMFENSTKVIKAVDELIAARIADGGKGQ